MFTHSREQELPPRRWPSIKPTFIQLIVFAGFDKSIFQLFLISSPGRVGPIVNVINVFVFVSVYILRGICTIYA